LTDADVTFADDSRTVMKALRRPMRYVQVTASSETATSPESVARQRAFAELASKILVPARPS